jgi:transposase
MAEQRSSTGEHIYVGVDVHKNTSTVTCVCPRQMVQTAPVPADPARLAERVSRWFPGALLSSAYEAGCSGFVLHRARTTAGVTNRVVHPASVAVAAGSVSKVEMD